MSSTRSMTRVVGAMAVVIIVLAAMTAYFATVSVSTPAAKTVTNTQTVTATVTTSLTATVTATQKITELDEIIEGAKKEGKLMLYMSLVVPQIEESIKVFEKKYPFIKVEYFRGSSSAVLERVTAERLGGKRVVDIIETDDTIHLYLKKQGWLMKYLPPESKVYPETYIDKDGYYVFTRASEMGVIYNTQAVKPEDAPKTWQDIVDPKWRGKLTMGDPFVHPASRRMMLTMKDVLKDKWQDWMKAFGAVKPQWQVSLCPTGKVVSTGAAAIGVAYITCAEKGAGFAFVEPLIAVPVGTAIYKDAPHPNAAKLFFDWFLSEESQQLHNKYLAGPTRPGLPNPIPELAKLKKVIIAPEPAGEELENVKADFQALLK